MRNLQNEIVDTSVRPDTMATYFASVHWKSHLAHLVPDSTILIQDGIPVPESEFLELELLRVPKKLEKAKHVVMIIFHRDSGKYGARIKLRYKNY